MNVKKGKLARFYLHFLLPFILPFLCPRVLPQRSTRPSSLRLSVLPQKVSEKVGGAEGTKLDDDFKEMEKVNIERKYCFKCIKDNESLLSGMYINTLNLYF